MKSKGEEVKFMFLYHAKLFIYAFKTHFWAPAVCPLWFRLVDPDRCDGSGEIRVTFNQAEILDSVIYVGNGHFKQFNI